MSDTPLRVGDRKSASTLAAMIRSQLPTASVLVFGHVTIALIGVASLRLLTELAPRELFGEANLLITMLTLGMTFAVAPFSSTVVRYQTAACEKETTVAFNGEALACSLIASGTLAVAVSVGLVLWGGLDSGSTIITIAAAAIWLVAAAARNVISSRYSAERRQSTLMAIGVLEALLLVGMTAGALMIHATSSMYVAGQAAAGAITVLIATFAAPWPVWRGLRWPSRNSEFVEKVAVYGTAFVPMTLVGWLANLADRYVLAYVLGADAVGQYVAAFAIANRGMALGNGILNDLFRPVLFEAENRGDREKVRRVFRAWIAVSFGLSVVALLTVYLVGGLIVRLLLADGYRAGAVEIMLWVALAYAINGMIQVLENQLLSLNASTQLILPLAVGGFANLFFSSTLIPWTGIPGAAQASCASFAVQAVVTALILGERKKARTKVRA